MSKLQMYKDLLQVELNDGVAIEELRALTGRLGELAVAEATNGKMAATTNQHGYDVISKSGRTISVKTAARSKLTRIDFNESTLKLVHDIAIVRYVDGDFKVAFIVPVEEARKYMTNYNGKLNLTISNINKLIELYGE